MTDLSTLRQLAAETIKLAELETPGPCPFCGAKAEHFEIREPEDPNFGAHFISCTNAGCEASTNLQWSCKEDARPLLVERWNRRTAAPTLAKAVEALLLENQALRDELDAARTNAKCAAEDAYDEGFFDATNAATLTEVLKP